MIPYQDDDSQEITSKQHRTKPDDADLVNENEESDDLQFEVTEAHHNEQEIVGGFKDTARHDSSSRSTHRRDQDPALDTDDDDEDFLGQQGSLIPDPAYQHDHTEPNQPVENGSAVRKLSEREVREISNRLYHHDEQAEYLSDDEKAALLKDISSATDPHKEPVSQPTADIPEAPVEHPIPIQAEQYDAASSDEQKKGFDNAPIVPPKRALSEPSEPIEEMDLDSQPRPKMANRSRGIAYYWGKLIFVSGGQELHDDDDLSIQGRDYILKKKTFDAKTISLIVGPIAALLIFVFIVSFGMSGDRSSGRIVGLALDDYGQPQLTNAQIRIPELGTTITCSSQGFFQTDQVPAGTYEIEYLVDGEVISSDYATVVGGKITTLTLEPQYYEEELSSTDHAEPVAQVTETQQTSPEKAKVADSQPKKKTSKKSNTPNYAKLTLNVTPEGARLAMNSDILGAGNLTYSKIKAGKYTYEVSKDGYQTATGTITLRAGQDRTLSLELEPLSGNAKAEMFNAGDWYYSAYNLWQSGEYSRALDDVNEALSADPGYLNAYQLRAQLYEQLGRNEEAYDDWVRVGEIYNFRDDLSNSVSAYGRAIQLNPQSTAALLGRAKTYLSHGEEIAAIADFDQVVSIDKRNLEGYLGLGHARYAQGYFNQALEHFKDARSEDKYNPEVYINMMMCYLAQGDMKQVEKTYERFEKYASEQDIERFQSEPEYAALREVINSN